MPSAINKINIKTDFESDFYHSQSDNYTNRKIVNLVGKIRRTPNDNIVFNLYYGLREDFKKNKTIKINVNELGEFETFINLEEGDGLYYITAHLLLDDNSYDTISTNIELNTVAPQIESFNIENYDFINTDQITEEKIFVFNKQNANQLNLTFISYSDVSNKPRFYKLWLSTEEEPLSYLPLNKNKNIELVNIADLSNGDYFVYLKIIDSYNNEVFKRLKFNLNKSIPKLKLDYLKIINDGYFVDYESTKNNIQLLINIKSGLLIKEAEYRIYKDNKILSPKINDEFIKLNADLTRQVKASGIFYLKEFNISKYFDLTNGDYFIEVFFKDTFDNEFVSNRVMFISKKNKPNFYSEQISLNNPSSLVLDYANQIDFIFEDLFFNFYNKQINCWIKRNDLIIPIQSVNTNWEPLGNGKYKTTLNFNLNNNHLNFKENEFLYDLFYFEMSNDYNEESTFILPMVFKAQKNIIVLSNEYVYDENNELNKQLNYINENHSSAEFLIENDLPTLNFQVDILNEVNFGNFTDYKTHNNELILSMNNKEKVIKFTQNEKIFIDLELETEEEKQENEKLDEENYYFELSQIELKFKKTDKSNVSQFYVKSFDGDRFVLPIETINAYGLEDEVLIEIASDMEIKNSEYLSTSYFNDRYSFLKINKKRDFLAGHYKELESFDFTLVNKNNKLKTLDYTFNIEFFKKINFFNNINLGEINSLTTNLKLPLNYPGSQEDIIFFFDLNNEFETKTSFNKNSHDYKIITEGENTYLEFLNLLINPNTKNGINQFYYYVKYKNIEKVERFTVTFNLNTNKKWLSLTPLNKKIINSEIKFELQNYNFQQIEIKVNGVITEFDIKENLLSLKPINLKENNLINFKVTEKNNLVYYLTPINLFAENKELLPGLHCSTEFAKIEEFNEQLISFFNISKNTNVKIEIKRLFDLTKEEKLQLNENYLLIELLNKNNNFNYYFELSKDYQNKIFEIKCSFGDFVATKLIKVIDFEPTELSFTFEKEIITNSEYSNKINLQYKANPELELELLVNSKIIKNGNFECYPGINYKFELLNVLTKQRHFLVQKNFNYFEVKDLVVEKDLIIKRDSKINFFSVLRNEELPDTKLQFVIPDQLNFGTIVQDFIYFLPLDKRVIQVENNNDCWFEFNGELKKDKVFTVDVSSAKELIINSVTYSLEKKFFRKIRIIEFNKFKQFDSFISIDNKNTLLNKVNFIQLPIRLSVSKPILIQSYRVKTKFDSYQSFSKLAYFLNRGIKISRFLYDLIYTKYHYDKILIKIPESKIQTLFIILASEYNKYYNGAEINNYTQEDLIKIVKRINIDYKNIYKLINGVAIDEINDL